MELPGFIYYPSGSVDEDRIYWRDRVTDTWPRGAKLPSPAIALLVQDEAVTGIGLFERGDAVTSFQRRITVSGVHLLNSPASIGEIAAAAESQARQRVLKALLAGGPVPPATWAALRRALRKLQLHDYLDDLDRRANPPPWVSRLGTRARRIVEWEQDATGLVLDFERLDRRELAGWVPPDDPLPFLAGLESTELREDQLLLHDMRWFGDWETEDVRGFWTIFSSKAGRRVGVLNVNRHPLETTLGADLVYYNHDHRSYTIIQYKRMQWEGRSDRGGRTPVYRPGHDKNLPRQLNRMRTVESGMHSATAKMMSDYRLGPGICFLKVCKPDLELGTSDLCQGMYIGLELWELVLKKIKKPKTLPAISFESGARYLNNSEFISLVRGGWIGSMGEVTAHVEQYITRSLRSGHSITLASEVG